mgnify:CR=1 FL=1
MSVTIDAKKLKFHVLGNGFDNVRNDSGKGTAVKIEVLNVDGQSAVIDDTETYLWLMSSSGALKKYDLETLEEVTQTTVPSDPTYHIYHPTNVENNIGVVFKNESGIKKVYIFDLTTDAIINSGEVDYIPTSAIKGIDCILVDNVLKIVAEVQFRNSTTLYTLNINDLTMNKYTVSHACCGFVDDNKLYGYMVPEWFYQSKFIYGYNADGSIAWQVEGANPKFPNLSDNISGFGNLGFIWIPCKVNDIWKLGKFVWSGSTDFQTPHPIKTIGKFDSMPNLANYPNYYAVAHDYGRTRTVFRTSIGLYLCDYNDLELLDNSSGYYPIGIRNRTIICTDYSKTYVMRI